MDKKTETGCDGSEARLIRIYAAALCSEKKNEALPIPPSDETEARLELVRALHGRAKYLKDGLLHIYPLKYSPVFEGIRLERPTGADFMYYAGLCATLGISVGADEIVDPPAPAARNAARLCMGRAGELRETPAGGLCCGMSSPPAVFHICPDAPALFVAGMMTGASLGWRDTDFIFDCCAPGPLLRFCLRTVSEYGGKVLPLAEGVRICTRRGDLPPLPENLRKKHRFFMPRSQK